MAKFMNAELLAIRDSLCCGHCGSTFKGSDSQAWKVKYEKKTVYCSETCRHAALKNKFSTPVPNRGPCLTCKKEFFSRTAKFFCCLDCYIQSEQFKQMTLEAQKLSLRPESVQKRAELAKKGEVIPCMDCGEGIYQKLSRKRRFCNTSCYRAFMAKRFDRWIANPEGMALPQCYDEFLDKEVLPCFVEGCGWAGQHLTLHMNQAHGIPRDDFKRAAGFNLSTGVIAKPLAKLMRERPNRGVALTGFPARAEPGSGLNGSYLRYQSAECKEHQKKARALAGPGPMRICVGCSSSFQQTTQSGRTLYCSTSCRSAAYSKMKKKPDKERVRDGKGRFIDALTVSK